MKTVPIDMPEELIERLGIREEPGWRGPFTRQQSPLATLDNGTRIKKQLSEEGDHVPDGTTGTVLGSIGHASMGVMYWVEWDTDLRHAIAIHSRKLARA